MSKSYIVLSKDLRNYKLDTKDIRRIYRINKKKTPQIPNFASDLKVQTETDDDVECLAATTLWAYSMPHL